MGKILALLLDDMHSDLEDKNTLAIKVLAQV